MIGIMSSQSRQATPAQPHNVDEGDSVIKSPSSGTAKMSTITSFFKPKTPKITLENPLDKLHLVNGGGHASTSTEAASRKGVDPSEGSAPKVGGQRSKVLKKGLKSGDGNSGFPVSRKDGKDERTNCLDASDKEVKNSNASGSKNIPFKLLKAAKKAKCSSRDSDPVLSDSQPKRSSVREDASSKKRKKNPLLDSSSDDFEVDQRMKMPKKEQVEREGDQEIAAHEAAQTEALILDVAQDEGSVEDIFEVEEDPGNPTVISYFDFLNESVEASGDDNTENQPAIKKELQNDDPESDNIEEIQQPSENLRQSTLKLVPKQVNPCPEQGSESERKILPNDKNPNKQGPSLQKRVRSTNKSEDDPQEKSPDPYAKIGEESPARHVPDDDSVLMVTYSEYLEEKPSIPERGQSPVPLQAIRAKQKVITIEAQVHTPPHHPPPQTGDENKSTCSSDVAIIDLCHSPESQKTPPPQKRTSNVVVNVSDLDLMIVSTDNASSTAASKKLKTVYSIFQRDTKEKPKEAELSQQKKPQQPTTSKPLSEISPPKRKIGRPRKTPQEKSVRPEKTHSLGKTDKPSRKDKPKTAKERSIKKAVEASSVAKPEEEESQGDEDQHSTKVMTTRRRMKPVRLGSSSEEDQEVVRGRAPRRSSNRAETVAMTSTPKAKNNKNVKARQLLRRAKSQQLSRTSPLPFQGLSRRVTPATKSRGAGQEPDSRDQARHQRDLTSVLGKKITRETDIGGKAKSKEKKAAGSDQAAVEISVRKPSKLAPMFTKEGRLALAQKQKSLGRLTSEPYGSTLFDDDETSRDSVRSDGGGDGGGAKRMTDPLPRHRESEVEPCYPPFPTVSHVLQRTPEMEGNTDWWKLPFPNSLGEFQVKDGGHKPSPAKNLRVKDRLARLGEFTLCCEDTDEMVTKTQSFSGHAELSHDTQRIILDQIKAANPRFPVNRVFKRYLAKRKGERPVPKLNQVTSETTSDAKCKTHADSEFTRLKTEKPASAKRKSEVPEQREGAKRRRVAQEGSAKGTEAAFTGRIRLRRRSSRWVIRDDEDEEKQETAEPPTPRRSSRQTEQAARRERDSSKERTDRRTLRTRRGKAGGKEEAGCGGAKEGPGRKPEDAKTDTLAGLLWTDKYQPLASAEVIGNPQAMKRLTGWLTDWKKRAARIKKKMKRQQSKQQSKMPKSLLEDSDSDFDLGSDSDNSDSDDDDESLSNAMIVVGPHGCGKTAAVYACAKELGFKIFEVNASSKRTGKQILADLGEATQSHHLSAHHHGNAALKSFFPAKSPTSVGGAKPAVKKAAPIPKAFAAFYKAGADVAAKQGGKKTKNLAPSTKKSQVPSCKAPPKTPSNPKPQQAAVVPSGSKDGVPTQRLTSTSLILFEDVDIVFEEDKGFLSAIATFLKTTKRPIILTTSDDRYPEMFEEKCEMASFRKPSSPQLATHLQLLCLAENVYAPHPDLQHLVCHLDRDIRRCWLAAQFWVSSGAGVSTHRAHNGGTLKSGTSEDLKTAGAARAGSPIVGRSKVLCGDGVVRDNVDGSSGENRRCPTTTPTPQGGFFESSLGLCNLSGVSNGISSMLTARGSDSSCHQARSTVAEAFQKDGHTSVYFRNVHALLPQISFGRSDHTDREESVHRSGTSAEAEKAHGRTARWINHKLIASLAAFADDISFSDSHLFSPRPDGKALSNSGWWGAGLKPSLSLDSVNEDNRSFAREATASSVRGFLEVSSFDRCCRNYEKTVEQFRELHPSAEGNGCQGKTQAKSHSEADKLFSRTGQSERNCLHFQKEDNTKCPDLYPTLVNKLPLLTRCNHSVLATDYLPMLRCICRSEQIREEMKIKRRFLHYLDSISLNLKKTDQIALCSILEAKQQRRPDDQY